MEPQEAVDHITRTRKGEEWRVWTNEVLVVETEALTSTPAVRLTSTWHP